MCDIWFNIEDVNKPQGGIVLYGQSYNGKKLQPQSYIVWFLQNEGYCETRKDSEGSYKGGTGAERPKIRVEVERNGTANLTSQKRE